MGLLTKDKILKGIEKVETVYIESLGGEVKIRPLSSSEWQEIVIEEQKGIGQVKLNVGSLRQTDGTMSIDLAKQTIASFKAKVKAVSLAMTVDGEEWSENEVEQLLPGVVDEIFEHVREISGIQIEEAELDRFREK